MSPTASTDSASAACFSVSDQAPERIVRRALPQPAVCNVVPDDPFERRHIQLLREVQNHKNILGRELSRLHSQGRKKHIDVLSHRNPALGSSQPHSPERMRLERTGEHVEKCTGMSYASPLIVRWKVSLSCLSGQ
jgi:predicted ATP-dependent protease